MTAVTACGVGARWTWGPRWCSWRLGRRAFAAWGTGSWSPRCRGPVTARGIPAVRSTGGVAGDAVLKDRDHAADADRLAHGRVDHHARLGRHRAADRGSAGSRASDRDR